VSLPLSGRANFGRVCRVIVGKNLTKNLSAGIILQGLRVKFTVDQTLRGPPNTANVQIYNLNPTNENRVKKEFDEVIIEVGYEGNSHVIFWGNIKFLLTTATGTSGSLKFKQLTETVRTRKAT